MPRSDHPDKPHFDYEQIALFGKCSLPVEDMSAILNVSVERLQRLMARPATRFFRSYRKGQALTRFNLLQRQIATATGEAKGNPALLTHLGAVLLGQNSGKKQPEEPQETAEKLIQNVSATQKEQMFNVLMGLSDKTEVIDDQDTKS